MSRPSSEVEGSIENRLALGLLCSGVDWDWAVFCRAGPGADTPGARSACDRVVSVLSGVGSTDPPQDFSLQTRHGRRAPCDALSGVCPPKAYATAEVVTRIELGRCGRSGRRESAKVGTSLDRSQPSVRKRSSRGLRCALLPPGCSPPRSGSGAGCGVGVGPAEISAVCARGDCGGAVGIPELSVRL